MGLIEYFDRIEIIHLPDRTDRYKQLIRELAHVGIAIDHPKVFIPTAIVPMAANGFPSRGVYGNFLSHLDILERAARDSLETVLILEDDPLFSKKFTQYAPILIDVLSRSNWGMCHFGHTEISEIAARQEILLPYHGQFAHSHCYAVHNRAIKRLVDFLTRTLTNDSQNSEGARMYIDGALSHFRTLNKDIEVMVTNPSLVAQRGSPSSLAEHRWFDQIGVIRKIVAAVRSVRDELWRYFGWPNKIPKS